MFIVVHLLQTKKMNIEAVDVPNVIEKRRRNHVKEQKDVLG